MSFKLMAEVVQHAPAGLSHAERWLLVALAESANTDTRECWPGREVLMERMQAEKWDSVAKVIRSLANKGLDLRVSRGDDASGNPIYAINGARRTMYRLPLLDRSAENADLRARNAVTNDVTPRSAENADLFRSAELAGPSSAENADPSCQEPIKQPAERRGMTSLAQQLAEDTGWPLAHCRREVDRKLAAIRARGTARNSMAVLRSAVANGRDDFTAPAGRNPGRPAATLELCDGTACPGSRHEWTRGRDRLVCLGHAA